LILHWQQKLSHSQTKTLHNPSILKKTGDERPAKQLQQPTHPCQIWDTWAWQKFSRGKGR
jgi:hypothetical protein